MLPTRSGLHGHDRSDQYGHSNWHINWHRQCDLDCFGDLKLWIVRNGKHIAGRSLYG
jgi:hypothetical protein